mgnify:CR=1 FL=1
MHRRGFPFSPGPLPHKTPEEERADRGRYLNAMQGFRWGQDGDVLEGVLSLLWRKTQWTQAVRTAVVMAVTEQVPGVQRPELRVMPWTGKPRDLMGDSGGRAG